MKLEAAFRNQKKKNRAEIEGAETLENRRCFALMEQQSLPTFLWRREVDLTAVTRTEAEYAES